MADKGYIGRIGNTGTQSVEAPVKPAGGGKGKGIIHKGGDLRAGRGGNK